MFDGSTFVVGNAVSPAFARLQLDDTLSNTALPATRHTHRHYDLAPGKHGYLAALDAIEAGVPLLASTLGEIGVDGQVFKKWNFAALFRAAMRAAGDDPANFVRDGADWFQINSAMYSAADDALLVSSRENLVVKIDYESGRQPINFSALTLT